MKVLIVAPNISERMGGEAVLPFHYLRELRALGVDAHALTHARVREELTNSRIWDGGRTHFIEDSAAEIALHKMSQKAPAALRDALFGAALGAVTLGRLGRAAQRLDQDMRFDVVHQPTPVSPALPSFLTKLKAPLVIGPMNGGMSYPPAFAKTHSGGGQTVVRAARAMSGLANRAVDGKRSASRLLVANARTQRGLPPGVNPARVMTLVDNGVDDALWTGEREEPATPTFVFVGRLVWWKGVELLLEAFARLDREARLVVVGDGEERERLTALAQSGPAAARIDFVGFRPQTEIAQILRAATALVLPSLREAGGAVILEAFASGVPAIATDWGGPQDYVTPETGILVAPTSYDAFVNGLAAAMRRLAEDAAFARTMGAAAQRHAVENYTWAAKARRMVEIYEDVIGEARRPTTA